MREILFRGKSINDNEWVFGDLIRNLIYDGREKEMRIGDIYFEHNGDIHGTAVYKVIPETVGQFTGLTDKNGKKIFEGDIVKGDLGLGYGDNENHIAYIEYQEDGMSFCLVEILEEDFGKCAEISDDLEVIGNIHDNPELFGE